MRPQFHFTATTGWINDPHGITFHEGQYHLFYQYLPDTLVWGSRCQWAHATSPDLISFAKRPIALEPGDGDHGIWTGSLIVDEGAATIFYTAVSESNLDAGRVRSAHPVDGQWDTWEKGPVVVDTPSDPSVVAFRDPFVTRDGDVWRMFVGGSSDQGEALALTYVSDDAVEWTDDGVALSRANTLAGLVATGSMWECPQFFELDGHHLMVTSVMDSGVLHHSIYAVGELRDGRFTPRRWGQLSYGESYYAPSFFRDKTGQPSLMFWMREVSDLDEGWIGAHSVPYTLSLHDDVLRATPSNALATYRGGISPSGVVQGLAADVVWNPGNSLWIRSGGEDVAQIIVEHQFLVLASAGKRWEMPYNPAPIRIIVDGPVVEVVSPEGVLGCPISPQGDTLEFSSDGGDATVWPLELPSKP